MRESVELTNDARGDVPATMICTGFTAEQYQSYAADNPDWAFLAGHPRAPQRHLDRPADQPLADVVEADGARGDHRARGSEVVRILTRSLLHDALEHHLWATERAFDECAGLTDGQLATSAAGTYGSIITTLRHLVGSDGWFLSFFPAEHTAIDEDAEPNLDELRTAWRTHASAWRALLEGDLDADDELVAQGDGWTARSSVGVLMAQVVHHGTDHRTQVWTMLTTLGMSPPEIDLWAYARATGRERSESGE